MNPAFSVIFLTTLIGAAQGLFLALFGAELAGFGAATVVFALSRSLWLSAGVLALLGASEAAPKSLLAGKRGAALLAFMLFLLVTFVSVNGDAFLYRSQLVNGVWTRASAIVMTPSPGTAVVHSAPATGARARDSARGVGRAGSRSVRAARRRGHRRRAR